ncbi:RES family NAD+ phosphorylase [Mucilaginibacter celer]|uniref:RES domain-containing protein n=1 Tax=Mucilaginibacter celer TaxID=2305508 RepID=A0A494VQ53_9SPHI|nr:RES family NAD+ phosphorylase [Mucilaginibacter celer]AYL96954.1 RES domain-containing protein [Mucilaginibacter celer]
MILYRITREKYAQDLSGRGGLLSAARWHDHVPVIYSSVNSSTAILEVLVHLQPEEIHNDLMIMSIVVPDDVISEELAIAELPAGWNNYPAPAILKQIGNAWLASKSALLLYIPSVIDPLAKNVLINPLHSDATQLKIGELQPFTFDKRLIKR